MNLSDLEKNLQKIIFPSLEQGRQGVDKPHTEAVVHYLKLIVKNNPQLNLDLIVLLIAAYAHDWGYGGMFENGKSLQMADVAGAKEQHMLLGSDKRDR